MIYDHKLEQDCTNIYDACIKAFQTMIPVKNESRYSSACGTHNSEVIIEFQFLDNIVNNNIYLQFKGHTFWTFTTLNAVIETITISNDYQYTTLTHGHLTREQWRKLTDYFLELTNSGVYKIPQFYTADLMAKMILEKDWNT